MRRALALLGLVACGDGVAPPPPSAGDHGSGSRLRAIVLATDDGLTVFQGRWLDTELDESCSFTDGRCLPRFGSQAGFRDPACTEPVYRVDSCDEPPSSFLYEAGEGCAAEPTIRRVGERVASDGDTIYGYADGVCGELVADADLYAAGDVVPLSTFVAAERVVSGGRPRAVFLVAEDGAYQLVGWEEAIGGAPCWARPTGEDVLCVPENAPWIGSTYGDSACVTQLAVTYPDECSAPPTVAFCETCDRGQRFVVLEDPWDGDVFSGEGNGCALQDRSVGAEYLELGAARNEARLGTLTREAASGSSPRVQPSWRDSNHEGYTDASRYDFYDTARERPCYFYRVSDGTTRCLDLESYAARWYEDPACTVEIRAVQGVPDAPPPTIGFWFDACAAQLATLGDALPEAYVLDTSTGACTAVTAPLYPAVADADLDLYVEAVPTVE